MKSKKKINAVMIICAVATLVIAIAAVFVVLFARGSLSKNTVSNASYNQKSHISSSPKPTDLKRWQSFTLNQRVALLIQATADMGEVAAERQNILAGTSYAMTGTISNGTVYIKSGKIPEKIADIRISGSQIFIKNLAANNSSQTTLPELIRRYANNSLTPELAAKVISLTAMQATVPLDRTELDEGNFMSLNGTWQNSNGHTITFENGNFTSNAKSFSAGEQYQLEEMSGDPALGDPFTLAVKGLDNTYLAIVPAGDDVGKDQEKVEKAGLTDVNPIKDVTDTSKDRIMIVHPSMNSGDDIASYFTASQDGGDAAFYRVN